MFAAGGRTLARQASARMDLNAQRGKVTVNWFRLSSLGDRRIAVEQQQDGSHMWRSALDIRISGVSI